MGSERCVARFAFRHSAPSPRCARSRGGDRAHQVVTAVTSRKRQARPQVAENTGGAGGRRVRKGWHTPCSVDGTTGFPGAPHEDPPIQLAAFADDADAPERAHLAPERAQLARPDAGASAAAAGDATPGSDHPLSAHIGQKAQEQKILDQWNTNAQGRNQGLVHLVDYSYARPTRLETTPPNVKLNAAHRDALRQGDKNGWDEQQWKANLGDKTFNDLKKQGYFSEFAGANTVPVGANAAQWQ